MKGDFSDAPNTEDRFDLGQVIGTGVFGTVYEAYDNTENKKKVAIKIQKYDEKWKCFIEEEYKVLKELSSVIYMVSFFGMFKKENEIWFVLEFCDGGPVIDLVTALLARNRRMSEEHIAYILKEVVKALIYLHENQIIHRDVKSNNILLTKEGEVKLCDLNLARRLRSVEGRASESLGSPCWMAPELVTANHEKEGADYDNRVDVWALGITAIELGDGKAPFQDMHPSRTLFQIIKNPPPNLQKVSNWTDNYHDFISECLNKTAEYRPYIMEVIEHPFLEQIPENNYHLTLEIKSLVQDLIINRRTAIQRGPEVNVFGKYIKKSRDGVLERILEEDLADLDPITESKVLDRLRDRLKRRENHTFIGDILLVLNPNEKRPTYDNEFHRKYQGKSRSDNPPHIYTIADKAYQDALHHVAPQQIVLSGESGSGKTSNYLHLIDHLFYLGENMSINTNRIRNAIKVVHALTHASTPVNDYSTRCVMKTNVAYGKTGKLSCATFGVYCLEKWRVSSVDMDQSNFHFIYYTYDGLMSKYQNVQKYKLDEGRKYRYLRVTEGDESTKPQYNIRGNIDKFNKIKSFFTELEFSNEQIELIYAVVAAVLNLGEVRIQENEDGTACIQNKEYVTKFCDLLKVSEKKLSWALTNYCLVRKGNVMRKRNTTDEARDLRDVLSNTLYARLVDYIVAVINDKLSLGKAVFGEKYKINLLDYFGFECFKKNHLPQLYVNCLNEQLQYHYLQRVFSWEILDLKGEELEYKPVEYFDNKKALNQLMSKPDGMLYVLDDASKKNLGCSYVMDCIQNQESSRIMMTAANEFSVAHYTGVVSYNAKEMPDKNRDFLAPEIIETMRNSEHPIIKMLFTNKLDKTGNVMITFEENEYKNNYYYKNKGLNANQYSQVRRMRTSATVFRALCLDLLKELSIGSGSGGTHFVRCIRADLKGQSFEFNRNLVKQQIRALAVVETAKARQVGYSQRISFPEFLRRYKFLAFDFDENVDVTRDNCRLLLVRLKMEGWAIGKSKVFLKYYNEEYLSRLYETQVKKIIKIQSILRGFLAKCKVKRQTKDKEKECIDEIKEIKRRRSSLMTEDEAAGVIQRAYRKTAKRKEVMLPLTEPECHFIRPFATSWKSKSVLGVLMTYRATKLQDFFNFCQQVHFYNQHAYYMTLKNQEGIDIDYVDRNAQLAGWIGTIRPTVMKVHFRLDEIPFYDTSDMCDPLTNVGGFSERDESWDMPYKWREQQSVEQIKHTEEAIYISDKNQELINIVYTRDPHDAIPELSSPPPLLEEKSKKNEVNAVRQSISSCSSKRDNKTKSEPAFSIRSMTADDNRYSYEKENFHSTPANKDFDYIKAKPMTSRPKHVDPIAELRNISARRESAASDDEPPFNFQAMLRKTNYQRESIKRATSRTGMDARRFSISKDRDGSQEQMRQIYRMNGSGNEPIVSKHISMELRPGVIMEGMEVAL